MSNDHDEQMTSDFRAITENLIRLSVKFDTMISRLERLETLLDRDYVRKESLSQCTKDLERIGATITWLSRAVAAAFIGILVTVIQMNMGK